MCQHEISRDPNGNNPILLSVYDFDGTIYRGDATFDFYFFLLRRQWRRILLMPYQVASFVLYKLKFIAVEEFKKIFLSLKPCDLHKSTISTFWQSNSYKINNWVPNALALDKEHGNTLVCISASPKFLLEPILVELGFDVILCTDLTIDNTMFCNCKGLEKIRRLRNYYQGVEFFVNKVTFDSESDKPLFELASQKILVCADGTREIITC